VDTYKSKYGKNILTTKLYEKGIAKNIVEEVLENFETNNEVIDKLLSKKIANRPLSVDLLSKCVRFLSSRGYNYDEINSAIKRYKDNNGGENDESWD